MSLGWSSLGARDPRSLAAERLQLHYGALILASVAHSLIEHEHDDSHTNLGIEDGGARLVTRAFGGEPQQRCALAIAELELVWLRGEGVTDRLPLGGKALAEALAWADRTARAQGDRGVARREFPDSPASPLDAGGAFEAGDRVARAELGRWYANGRALFEELREREPRLSPIRVWPHHFDLGTVQSLRADDPDVIVEWGMSPGDDSFDEPYFYCSPYPRPVGEAPALTGPGTWHTEGFVSVVLTGTALLAGGADQQSTARSYIDSALAACRAVADFG